VQAADRLAGQQIHFLSAKLAAAAASAAAAKVDKTPLTVYTVDWSMLHMTHSTVQKKYADWQLPAYKNTPLLQLCGLHVKACASQCLQQHLRQKLLRGMKL